MQLKKTILTMSIVGILLFSVIGAGTILLPKLTDGGNQEMEPKEHLIDSMNNNEESAQSSNYHPRSDDKGVETVFYADFEGTPWDGNFSSNSGWLDSLYGYAHSGTHWAYSWGLGDNLTTPPLDIGLSPILKFWNAVESSFHPMDLEVYCNGDLIWSDYGYTHTTYAEQIVDLGVYEESTIILEFVGMTSDMYGQFLEDISVTAEFNDPPVALDDYVTIDEGGTVSVLDDGNSSVLDNDTDAEGDTLSASEVSGPLYASSFTLNADGTFSYTHDGSETSSDSFVYEADDGNGGTSQATVYITITPVNDAPVANDDFYMTDEDTTLEVSGLGVLENDTDAEGDALSALLHSDVSHGSLLLHANGSFSYTPDGGYVGFDEFTYVANDSSVDSNIATVNITIEEGTLPPVEVDKMIWNGETTVDMIEVYEGEIVQFNVSIHNPYEHYEMHWSGNISDELPCNLEYIPESTTLPLESHSDLDVEVIDLENNTVWWQVDREAFIPPGGYLNFTYLAIAVCCGDEPLENNIVVRPDELKHTSGGEDITPGNYDMNLIYGSDSATVKVICLPDILLEKYGKTSDDSVWRDSISTHVNTSLITFKIMVTIEEGVFDWVNISDTLPDFLSYNDYWYLSTSSYSPVFYQDGNTLSWNFSDIGSNEESISIIIYYEATILDCGMGNNMVEAIGMYGPHHLEFDAEPVSVHIYGCEDITVEKLVKPDCQDDLYGSSISFDYEDYEYVTFKVDIYLDHALMNLSVRDSLPQLLGFSFNETYVENSDGLLIPDTKYLFTITDNHLYWNFSYENISLDAGTHLTIYYCATVVGCGEYENVVNVTGFYYDGGPCCPEWVYMNDNATVEIICPSGVSMNKRVSLDGSSWVDSGVETFVGDIIWFKLRIKNLDFEQGVDGVTVYDILPDYLILEEVIDRDGAIVLSEEDHELWWFFTYLEASEVREIIFTARVIDFGESVNLACVYECNDSEWCDTVWVDVVDGMFVDKQVALDEDGPWGENRTVSPGDEVFWNVTISYYDDSDPPLVLYHVLVNDTLPEGVSYVSGSGLIIKRNDSTVWSKSVDPVVNGSLLTWDLTEEEQCTLLNGSMLTILFSTIVDDGVSGVLENMVNVSAYRCDDTEVEVSDTAHIYVDYCEYISCIKQVRNDNGDPWAKEINAPIGEIISFKISITNDGYGNMNNINVEDTLPGQLSYVEDSAQILFNGSYYDCEPITMNNFIVWDDICTCLPSDWEEGETNRYLHAGETVSILFDAETISAGIAMNFVEVNASMCSNAVKTSCSDTATVNISVEPLEPDAGGPYSGFTNENIPFSGSASGGYPPYTYTWDLDDDGLYDDASIANPSKSWSTAGVYTISLKVTDDHGDSNTHDTQVTVSEPQEDLYCVGSLQWDDASPSDTLTDTFTLRNSGDPQSELDWSIDEVPTWGDWNCSPASGTDLTPENGIITITVTVDISRQRNKVLNGTIKVINDNDPTDYDEIMITLTTQKSWEHPFLRFLQGFLDHFPILQKILSFLF